LGFRKKSLSGKIETLGMGIAQIAFDPTPPLPKGHYEALFWTLFFPF